MAPGPGGPAAKHDASSFLLAVVLQQVRAEDILALNLDVSSPCLITIVTLLRLFTPVCEDKFCDLLSDILGNTGRFTD